MYAPIALFVYNRVDFFQKTFEALKMCLDADKSDLFIFSDGPKDDKARPAVKEIRCILKDLASDKSFHKVTVVNSETNKGLATSIIQRVSSVISEYGQVIVLEDDCVPSQYFLRYMNTALEYYENDKTIGSIAGYAEMIDLPDDYCDDVYLSRRSCSWGWSTWADRWSCVDWKLKNASNIFKSPKLIRRINEDGTDRLMRLYRQTKKNTQSWSICFGAYHILNDWYVVNPRFSYIYNIGDDGSGVHTKEGELTNQYDLSLAIKEPHMKDLVYDRRIQKSLKEKASPGAFTECKRLLAAGVIVIKTNLGSLFGY